MIIENKMGIETIQHIAINEQLISPSSIMLLEEKNCITLTIRKVIRKYFKSFWFTPPVIITKMSVNDILQFLINVS